MADAPQVIAPATASLYRQELTRQPPAFHMSGKPMDDKDINKRMVKLDEYERQKRREINGKHARKLLQFVNEGRLAVLGRKPTVVEAGVLIGSIQKKTKVRQDRSNRLPWARQPLRSE